MAGFWNVRGWNSDLDSDDSILRSECLLSSDIDILGVADIAMCLLLTTRKFRGKFF